MRIRILIIFFMICETAFLYGQKGKNFPEARFNFDKFSKTTNVLYSDLNIGNNKAVKISFRELKMSDQANAPLFYPQKQEGERISFTDLLLWAAREKMIRTFTDFDFTNTISWDSINMKTIIDTSEADVIGIISCRVMESTIYDKNNNIVSVRPIAIMPVLSMKMKGWYKGISQRALFSVYLPEIVDLLSNHYTEDETNGTKTTLDFFVMKQYAGKLEPSLAFYSPLLYNWFDGDTASINEGFNVSWIYDKIKGGTYIDPYDKMFQGIGRTHSSPVPELYEEPVINTSQAVSARVVMKQVNLHDIKNYPLYFPEEPFLMKKSLIYVIYSGVMDGQLTVYTPFEEYDNTGSGKPLSWEETQTALGKEIIIVTHTDEESGAEYEEIVQSDNQTYEIKEYFIKEVEFCNKEGKVIGSKIIGIFPIREYIDNEHNDALKSKMTFFVPFNSELRKMLSMNSVFSFLPELPVSYFSFLVNEQYDTELKEYKKIEIDQALKMCGMKK